MNAYMYLCIYIYIYIYTLICIQVFTQTHPTKHSGTPCLDSMSHAFHVPCLTQMRDTQSKQTYDLSITLLSQAQRRHHLHFGTFPQRLFANSRHRALRGGVEPLASPNFIDFALGLPHKSFLDFQTSPAASIERGATFGGISSWNLEAKPMCRQRGRSTCLEPGSRRVYWSCEKRKVQQHHQLQA